MEIIEITQVTLKSEADPLHVFVNHSLIMIAKQHLLLLQMEQKEKKENKKKQIKEKQNQARDKTVDDN